MSTEKNTENTNATPCKTAKPVVKKRKRRLGDRHDGYKVQTLICPFILSP